MEEKRNIEVTLEQAVDWYYSGNETLRKLALSAYKEDEMKLSFNYISNSNKVKVYKGTFSAEIPANETSKYMALADLSIIARYFNGTWQKTIYNTGYFLGDYRVDGPSLVDKYNGIGIYEDSSSVYAGVVYFKKQEDVYQAIEILGNKAKFLFL